MNLGLEKTETEYCMFLNGGDEMIDFSQFAHLYNKIQGKLWGYGGTELYESAMEKRRKYFFVPYSKFLHKFSIKYVPHCSTIFKTNHLKKLGGYNDFFGTAADQAVMLSFALSERPVTQRKILTRFYLGGESTRSKNSIIGDYKLIEMHMRNGGWFENLTAAIMWFLVSFARKWL